MKGIPILEDVLQGHFIHTYHSICVL